MKIIITILSVYLVSLFSVTVLPRLSISYITINLILVIALFYLCQKDFVKGFIWAGTGGLFLDFLKTGFPSNFFILIGIALLVIFIIHKFLEVSNRYMFLIICFIFTFVYFVFLGLINHIEYKSFFIAAIISAVISLIPAILIMLFSHFFINNKKYQGVYLEE